MIDCKGETICQGDDVVVAQRRGSSIWLRTCKVTGWVGDKPHLTPTNGKTKSFTYTGRIAAIMVIEAFFGS